MAIVVVMVEVILIWKTASFGPVYTRTSGGVLKQQLNDLLVVVVPMSTVPYETKLFII